MLEKELQTYKVNLGSLVARHNGGWVLIFRDKIVGTFSTEHDAIKQGYDKFGNVPFLVKKIQKIENVLMFPRGTY